MKTSLRSTAWLSACFCLILLTLGVFLWFSTPRERPAEPSAQVTDTSHHTSTKPAGQLTGDLSIHTTDAKPPTAGVKQQTVTLISPTLPPVAYPIGSIGEACRVNDFPNFHWDSNLDSDTSHRLENDPFDSNDDWKSLKDPKCWSALETKIKPINPYLWGRENDTHGSHSALALVTIDNPLTFDRIFTDPAGDFARVQDALARPECQLSQVTTTNGHLNDHCHAEAFFNYALIMRFCYADFLDSGVHLRPRKYYWKKDNLTPEQDRSMWIQSLEGAWVAKKCEGLDPSIDLRLPLHTELREQIEQLGVYDETEAGRKQTLNGTLIDLAARLGDEAAALTYPSPIKKHSYRRTTQYDEEGYKYGPLAEWFTKDLSDPTNLFSKLAPSVDRLRELVTLFGNKIKVKEKVINVDRQVLARHLCTPPFYIPPSNEEDPTADPPSCREIINELRQESLPPSMLAAITTFEKIAIRLDVYE